MVMDKICEKALDKWAIEQRKMLTPRIRRLIAMASFDLYYGPLEADYEEEAGHGSDEMVKWPGFVSACKEIRKALDDLHTSDVWIDQQSEEVMTTEPQGFEDDNPDYDPNYEPEEDEDEESVKQKTEQKVWVEPMWEDIYHIDGKEVLIHVVGDKELYPHLN